MSKNTRRNREVVEEIMGKKIPSVMKTINSQIKKGQRIANKANMKKTNDKEKSLKKKEREKRHVIYKRSKIRMTTDLQIQSKEKMKTTKKC